MMPRPVRFLGLAQQLQALYFHTLEIVGRRARLERAAAQDTGTGRRHSFGRIHNLLFAFHRAGARHHDELIAADLTAVDFDRGPAFAEFLADKLVRCGDAHRLLHSGRGFQRFQTRRHIAHSYDTDDDALFALDGVHPVSKLRDPFANMVNLFSGGMGAHGNNHKDSIHQSFTQNLMNFN